jgi:hypothetical protein
MAPALVPGLGWLDQSPLLLTFAACVILGLVGAAWWITRRQRGISVPPSGTPL